MLIWAFDNAHEESLQQLWTSNMVGCMMFIPILSSTYCAWVVWSHWPTWHKLPKVLCQLHGPQSSAHAQIDHFNLISIPVLLRLLGHSSHDASIQLQKVDCVKAILCLTYSVYGKNKQLVTDEPVEKQPVEVQDCRKYYLSVQINLWNIPQIKKGKTKKITTCNRLDFLTLGFWPIMTKNLLGHSNYLLPRLHPHSHCKHCEVCRCCFR